MALGSLQVAGRGKRPTPQRTFTVNRHETDNAARVSGRTDPYGTPEETVTLHRPTAPYLATAPYKRLISMFAGAMDDCPFPRLLTVALST